MGVVMRLAPLGESKARQNRGRIDPEMFYDDTIRETIEDAWNRIYKQYPTKEYGHTYTWEQFKAVEPKAEAPETEPPVDFIINLGEQLGKSGRGRAPLFKGTHGLGKEGQ